MLARGASLFALLISCGVTLAVVGPKCCGDGDALTLNGTEVFCEGLQEFFGNCTSEEFCEEVATQGGVFKVFCDGSYLNVSTPPFSKCCPSGMMYNGRNHSCEPNQERIEEFANVRRFGLSECGDDKVVVDFFISAEDLASIANGSTGLNLVKVGEDPFCLDGEVSRGRYVMRACVGKEICGEGFACVRKCCPDGYHYGINRTCEPFFESGVNWNGLPDAFQDLKGGYIKY